MQSIVRIITSSTNEFVNAIDFIEEIASEKEICIKRQCGETRGFEEIVLTIISSSALVVVANALCDFVNRKKIQIQISSENGEKIDIKAEGSDLNEASEIIGYLSNNIKKNVDEKVEKDIKEHSLDIKFEIKRD